MRGGDTGGRLAAAGWALLAAALLLLACGPGWAQGLGVARESAVKAAFLFKFGSFVEWPPGVFRTASDSLVIGVYGDDAVASELEQLARGRAVEGRPVHVHRIRDPAEVGAVHVLFAGGRRESRMREVIAAARGPVLTVADAPLESSPAPVLYFTQEEGRVRFSASLPAAAARNLKLSARLLAVAQHVEAR